MRRVFWFFFFSVLQRFNPKLTTVLSIETTVLRLFR